MRLVIIESPYGASGPLGLWRRWRNRVYARRALRDCLNRGEAPFASHLLYTQPGVLRDERPDERVWGIEAGLNWGRRADATVVYCDRGISFGMKMGIQAAEAAGRPVERRFLDRVD